MDENLLIMGDVVMFTMQAHTVLDNIETPVQIRLSGQIIGIKKPTCGHLHHTGYLVQFRTGKCFLLGKHLTKNKNFKNHIAYERTNQ